MIDKIQWQTDVDKALVEAYGMTKPVLLDFFNPD